MREVTVSAGDPKRAGYGIEDFVPPGLMDSVRQDARRSIPTLAKDAEATRKIQNLLVEIPSKHRLILGDSRKIVNELDEESVHLAITSPPYWTLKRYEDNPNQLGHVDDYDRFLTNLCVVWEGVLRALVPGGRLVIVVGDVCLSRRRFGRHVVFPLHASIQERCRTLGYDNLAPIIWHKIANATLEAQNGSRFLGKPYEPNSVIKNDIEFILLQRKPGGYRSPSLAARVMSVLPSALHQECFQQIWTLSGASTANHPAPYPLKLAERLIRMFSFVGDTILDPFMGTGTTNVAAAITGRNSVGIEVEPSYFDMASSAVEQGQSRKKSLLL